MTWDKACMPRWMIGHISCMFRWMSCYACGRDDTMSRCMLGCNEMYDYTMIDEC